MSLYDDLYAAGLDWVAEYYDMGDMSEDEALQYLQQAQNPTQTPTSTTASTPVATPTTTTQPTTNNDLYAALEQAASDYGWGSVDELWEYDPDIYSQIEAQYSAPTSPTAPVATTATTVTTNPTEPAVAKAPDLGAATALPSWYSNPFSKTISQNVNYEQGDRSWSQNEQVTNPQWQAYEDAVRASTAPVSGISDSPWALDAAAFHQAVDPLLQNAGSYYDPNFVNTKAYEYAINYNPVGQLYQGSPSTMAWASPEGQRGSVDLQLAGGKTWTPSGANSGIWYHPAGETTVTEGGGVAVNPYGYYDISGDLSALLGQPDSNVHANIKYVEQNGKLVPIEDPNIWNYSNSGMLGDFIQGLGPIPNIALAIASGGMTLPEQLAASAALSVAQGADLGGVLKNAAGQYLGSQLTGSQAVQDAAKAAGAIDPALSAALNAGVTGAISGALTGNSIIDSALQSAALGGTNAAIKELAGNIPGYADLSPQTQQLLSNAMTGVLAGKPIDQVALNAALAAGKQAMQAPPTSGLNASYSVPTDPNAILDQLNAAGLQDVADQYAMGDLTDAEAQQYLTGTLSGNYSVTPDYSFTAATPIAPDVTDPYSLWTPNTQYQGTVGLNPFAPSSPELTLSDLVGQPPNLTSMGGGQGLTAPTVDTSGNTGVMGGTGFTADNSQPSIGDPNSFINNPAVTGQPVAAPPEPVVTAAPTVTPTSTTPTPPTSTTTQQSHGNDLMSILALAGLMQAPAQQQAPVQPQLADIKSMQNLWGPGIETNFLTSNVNQFADGGSVEELLHLLRS